MRSYHATLKRQQQQEKQEQQQQVQKEIKIKEEIKVKANEKQQQQQQSPDPVPVDQESSSRSSSAEGCTAAGGAGGGAAPGAVAGAGNGEVTPPSPPAAAAAVGTAVVAQAAPGAPTSAPKTLKGWSENIREAGVEEGCVEGGGGGGGVDLLDYVYALQMNMGVLGEVFGNSLNADWQWRTPAPVPSILVDSILFLQHSGMGTQGIFRISGEEESIADLRRLYDEGGSRPWLQTIQPQPDTAATSTATATAILSSTTISSTSTGSTNIDEVHNTSSLLKLYLRCLPDPLIPRDCYEPLCAVMSLSRGDDEDVFISKIKNILCPSNLTNDENEQDPRRPSRLNIRILAYLFQLLHQITMNSGTNKMTGENLAIVFAPTLVRPMNREELGLFELRKGIDIVNALIERAADIFGDVLSAYPLVPIAG
jgi:hypothetical protein